MSKYVDNGRPHAVRKVEVIHVEYRRGEGVEGDPVRIVTAIYSLEGELIAEHDPWMPGVSAEPSDRLAI